MPKSRKPKAEQSIIGKQMFLVQLNLRYKLSKLLKICRFIKLFHEIKDLFAKLKIF